MAASTSCRKGTRKSEPAEARSVLGLYGLTVPLRNSDAGGAEGFGGAHDGAGVAGVLHAVEHDHQGLAAEEVLHLPRGRLDQRHHALAGFGAGDGLEQGVGQHDDLHAGEAAREGFGGGAHGFGGQHDLDFAIAAQGFFQQVERFGDAPAFGGEGAARDGAAHLFQQRIGGAGDRFRGQHPITIMSLTRSE